MKKRLDMNKIISHGFSEPEIRPYIVFFEGGFHTIIKEVSFDRVKNLVTSHSKFRDRPWLKIEEYHPNNYNFFNSRQT